MAKYRPIDSLRVPRFTGIPTFLRLPYLQTTEGIDFAVVGVPFDTGATFRVGQRFAPAAIRQMSVLLRGYNQAQDIDVFEYCSGVDYGDAIITPGYTQESYAAITETLKPIFASGVVPVSLGGDHSITLPELRAVVPLLGPVALIHFDSHGDIWEESLGQRYMHGTPFRRALEEDLIDPSHSIQVGIRGPVYSAEDMVRAGQLGLEVLRIEDFKSLGPLESAEIIRRRVGGSRVFLTFDIDCLDPAYAPGTGTPEVGGLTSWECLQVIRRLAGLNFVGFDIVEVLPAYDHSDITSTLAANIAFEFLTLLAIVKRAADQRRSQNAG